MNVHKKKAALDKALQIELYKLGESYGKQLKKIYSSKAAKDALPGLFIGTKPVNTVLKNATKGFSFGSSSPESWNILNNYRSRIAELADHEKLRSAGSIGNVLRNSIKEPIINHSAKAANSVSKVASSVAQGASQSNVMNRISSAAKNAIEFGGSQAANFGNSISSMVGGISPKAAELFNKYPKTTGLAAAAAITAALAGAGYGAYKLYKNNEGKNKRGK